MVNLVGFKKSIEINLSFNGIGKNKKRFFVNNIAKSILFKHQDI